MVDALKHAGKNPTRASLLRAGPAPHREPIRSSSWIDSHATPTDYFPIGRTYLVRYLHSFWNVLATLEDLVRKDTRMNGHFRTVLVAAVAVATLVFANAALAANTATISVWHTPMVWAGSDSTTIHVSIPQDDPTGSRPSTSSYRLGTARRSASRPERRSATSTPRRCNRRRSDLAAERPGHDRRPGEAHD